MSPAMNTPGSIIARPGESRRGPLAKGDMFSIDIGFSYRAPASMSLMEATVVLAERGDPALLKGDRRVQSGYGPHE